MHSFIIWPFIIGALYILYKTLKKKKRFFSVYLSSIILYMVLIVFSISLIINSQITIASAINGMRLWANVIFPALFPFFVCTDLLINLGFAKLIGFLLEPIMRPIFNVPGSGSVAFFLGILSGYPVGAKTAISLYENGLCTDLECERLLAFCNNAGPIFIFGSVSATMFKMPSIGVILYIAHVAASITVGILFRFYRYDKSKALKGTHFNKSLNSSISTNSCNSFNFRNPKIHKSSMDSIKKIIINSRGSTLNTKGSFGILFEESIKKSLKLTISIAGFIIFFSVLLSMLEYLKIISFLSYVLYLFLGPFGINYDLIVAQFSGILEITNGVYKASLNFNSQLIERLILVSFIIGWAGVSVHCQVIGIIGKSGIKFRPYLIGKFLHGLIAAFYTFLILKLLPINSIVFLNKTTPQSIVYKYEFTNMLLGAFIYLGIALLIIFTFCIFIIISNSSIIKDFKLESFKSKGLK